VNFERGMLTEDQILQHVPEQNLDFINRTKIKAKDHRGRLWYDDQALRGLRPFKCELEALSLETRLDLVREAIERHVDRGQLQRVKDRAERERQMLGSVIWDHVESMVQAARQRAGGASEATPDEPQPEPSEADSFPDEGVIPADVVDTVSFELDSEIWDRIRSVADFSPPQLSALVAEMKQRVAQQWLRGR
jgi:hypothetical protein